MIKIEKIFADGKLLGIEDGGWFYLYKGLNTKTNMCCELIAKQNEVDMSPTFDKEIRKIIRIRLKKELPWVKQTAERIIIGSDNEK